MSKTAIVVGAGRSGLHASRLLAAHGLGVALIERLPAPGGQEPEEGTSALARAVRTANVELVLGTLAVSLTGAGVETLGIDGARTFPADALVVATGTRPATLGELRVTGDRCAGILPGSAMIHLIESGVLPGWRPVIVGGGDLARHCLSLCLRAGAHSVSVVSPTGRGFPAVAAADAYNGWRLVSIHGQARVDHVVLAKDGETLSIPADAVILAHQRRPMRNIESAVQDGGIVVGCHSSADPKTDEDAVLTARATAARVIELIGDRSPGT
jgi:NADPH-dependent 2,4-dienoyl-CoA reductase/sulfur reductase-like enzyme